MRGYRIWFRVLSLEVVVLGGIVSFVLDGLIRFKRKSFLLGVLGFEVGFRIFCFLVSVGVGIGD